MISIDSDALKNITSAAGIVAENVATSENSLNLVVSHDDWNCAEKDQINEKLIAIKKNIAATNSATNMFLSLVRENAEMFEQSDRNVTNAFQKVQDRLGDFFKIKTTVSVCNNVNVEKVIEANNDSGARLSDAQPIKICYYSDLDFGKIVSKGK